MFSQCRQINHCNDIRGEYVLGERGKSNCENQITPTKGTPWRYRKAVGAPYQLEHADLIASIRAGEPINEAQNVAESTMTGIIGREACYSGQEITWDQAMKSTTKLGPGKYEFGPFEVPPAARPGIYRFT